MARSSRRDPFERRTPVEVSLSPHSERIVDRLNGFYGIKVTSPAVPFDACFPFGQYLSIVEGHPPSPDATDSFLPVFEEEFGIYPRSLVRSARLRRVVLCGEVLLSRDPNPRVRGRHSSPVEQDIRPHYFSHESVGGLADCGLFYLAISGEESDPDLVRSTIHHEFYHCIQREQFGSSGDPEWELMNPPDFVYGPGGTATLDSDADFWSRPSQDWGTGFLNLYCESDPLEDQAEVFATMITEPHRLQARCAVDDCLRRKVERVQATLKDFCRDVNDGFWQRVRDSRAPFDL